MVSTLYSVAPSPADSGAHVPCRWTGPSPTCSRANAANDSGAVASARSRRRVTRASAADGRRDAGSQPVSQIVASDAQLSNGTAPVEGVSSSSSARAAASVPGSGNFVSVRKRVVKAGRSELQREAIGAALDDQRRARAAL